MPSVLIIDRFKSSIVMTSEVFKDKIPGTMVQTAETGQGCLDKLQQNHFDIIVIDFDLPDTDGVTLAKLVRSHAFKGPILITAFPEKIVEKAIEEELFHYADLCAWIKKPIKFEDLSKKIDTFLVEKRRVRKRFQTNIEAQVIGKGAGKGKRSPKGKGQIANMSIGGALIKFSDIMQMKIKDEVTLSFDLGKVSSSKDFKSSTLFKSNMDLQKIFKGQAKLKAKISWINKPKKLAGIEFCNLSDESAKIIECVLKNSEEVG